MRRKKTWLLVVAGLIMASVVWPRQAVAVGGWGEEVKEEAEKQVEVVVPVEVTKSGEREGTAGGFRKFHEAAVEQYRSAKKRYLQAVEQYRSARREFLKRRLSIRAWRRLSEEEKERYLERAKEFLLKTNETVVAYLRRVRERVEAMKRLDEERKNRILAEIDKDIAWLEGKREEIEAAPTPEELEAIGRQMRDYWHGVRGRVKRLLGEALAVRIDWVFERLRLVREKVAEGIEEAKAAGKDVSQLEAWLADFDEKLALAEEKYEAGKEAFASLSSVAEADRLFREGHAFLKEAHAYLKEAHRIVRKIVEGLREL